jgi:hypothetical protein
MNFEGVIQESALDRQGRWRDPSLRLLEQEQRNVSLGNQGCTSMMERVSASDQLSK